MRIPADTGDFRLLSRRAVESLRQLREQHRFMKGVFAWIGHSSDRGAVRTRAALRWRVQVQLHAKLWNFALEGFTSFTIAPLTVATYLGLLIAAVSFPVCGVDHLQDAGCSVTRYAGYPTLMVVILLLGGVQLVAIGVLGEYVGRMFNETKRRPLYLLNEFHQAASLVNGISQRNHNRAEMDDGAAKLPVEVVRNEPSVDADPAHLEAVVGAVARRLTFERIAQGMTWWCSGMWPTSSVCSCSASARELRCASCRRSRSSRWSISASTFGLLSSARGCSRRRASLLDRVRTGSAASTAQSKVGTPQPSM